MLLATIQLCVLDSTVLVIYVVAMLLIGWYFARRTRASEDYLLGGRRMNALVVGLSLFASLLSTISYLGYPAEMISHGPIILAGFIGYPVIVAVVGWVLIPAIMRWEVTTAYQILERRFHASVSVLASIIFLIIRLIWMALIISLMATKIIVPLLGIDPQGALWVSAVIALITVAYASAGGLRAVVVTDVVQTLILFGGALLALAACGESRG